MNAIDGVVARVSFATERAAVMTPTPVPLRWLVEAVEPAGYGALSTCAAG